MIKERLISALIGTILILAFQPFGLGFFGGMRWLLMLGLTVCVFFSCVVSEYILRYAFRLPHNPAKGVNYSIRRNIFYQVINIFLMTGTTVLFLDRFACNDVVDNHISWTNVLIDLGMFCGASMIIGLYWRNVYWKRHYMHELADAQRLNGILEERQRNRQLKVQPEAVTNTSIKEPSTTIVTEDSQEQIISSSLSNEKNEDSLILLEGSTKEHVSICPSEFLFAESDGNYVSVYYLKDNETKKSVLRTSIKNVAQALCGKSDITQCHRAFIANISFVEHIESRSSGIGLKLKGAKDIIPVSKTYVAEVKNLIQNPK